MSQKMNIAGIVAGAVLTGVSLVGMNQVYEAAIDNMDSPVLTDMDIGITLYKLNRLQGVAAQEYAEAGEVSEETYAEAERLNARLEKDYKVKDECMEEFRNAPHKTGIAGLGLLACLGGVVMGAGIRDFQRERKYSAPKRPMIG
jgi:hypothetical protein